MHPVFAQAVESLHVSYERLVESAHCNYATRPKAMPSSGVYLFSEGDRHLYVGRSNKLRTRYNDHCSPSADYMLATFAFILARHETNRLEPCYKKNSPNNRKNLIKDPVFLDAFKLAKERIRNMQYRHVEEIDQTRQALLEIYCAIALNTPYNDFGTH